VNHVVPASDLERTTRALGERIAGGPPAVMRMAKHLVNRAATSDLAGALDQEAWAQAIAITGEDHQEGLRAFFDKRPPRFTGR
jgi:2-(1,2-epoxy-1,2-dihydrophenyl)acetyl-CoA isomerase